jgi:hypothetical protein
MIDEEGKHTTFSGNKKDQAILAFIVRLPFDGKFPTDCRWDPRKRPRNSPALHGIQGLRHSERLPGR